MTQKQISKLPEAPTEEKDSDRGFLMWIHERLKHVHGENDLIDYMHKLRAIIAEIPADRKTVSVGQGKNSLMELQQSILANALQIEPVHDIYSLEQKMKTQPITPRRFRYWDRMQWAVEMHSKSCNRKGMLIGVAWHKITPPAYEGEPSRPLLFRTRNHARKWCAAKTTECARHSPDWRFRPVRVREMILANAKGDSQSPAKNL